MPERTRKEALRRLPQWPYQLKARQAEDRLARQRARWEFQALSEKYHSEVAAEARAWFRSLTEAEIEALPPALRRVADAADVLDLHLTAGRP